MVGRKESDTEMIGIELAMRVGKMIGIFFCQAEDGIGDFCLSRGHGNVYRRQSNTRYGQRLDGEDAKRWKTGAVYGMSRTAY